MPPTCSTLSSDIHLGYLICLHSQSHTARESYRNLVEFVETDVLNQLEVEEIFKKLNLGVNLLKFHKNLKLAENLKFNDRSVLEFLTFHYNNQFFPGLYDDLRKITGGRELYDKDWIRRFSEKIMTKDDARLENMRDFNRNTIIGFLLCLYCQGVSAEKSHATLMKHCETEIVTVEEIHDFHTEIKAGQFLKQKHELRLEKAINIYHVMEKVVEFSDLDARKSLQHTCHWIHSLVDTHPLHLNSLHIDYSPDHVSIISNPKILQKTLQNFGGLQGVITHENGTVTLDKNAGPVEFQKKFRKIYKQILSFGNVTVGTLKVSTNLAGNRDPDRYGLLTVTPYPVKQNPDGSNAAGPQNILQVENFYLKIDNFSGVPTFLNNLVPHTLKKLVIMGGNNRFPMGVLVQNERWMGAEVLITNQRFDDFANGQHVAHFKFVLCRLPYVVTIDQVLALKDTLLNYPDLRELKVAAQIIPDHYDEINIRLGTWNPRGTRNPRWAQFTYPTPNQHKVLQVCVLDAAIWIRGPGFVPGELEQAEQELREMETINADDFESFGYYR